MATIFDTWYMIMAEVVTCMIQQWEEIGANTTAGQTPEYDDDDNDD